jgi:predicted ATPase
MLHGRAPELGVLERVLDAGTHRVAIVDGEAGIGKTALLADIAGLAAARGFQTFTGAAEPSERDRPFAAIARTLRVEREVAELLGAAQTMWVDPLVDNGFRVTDAIVERLRSYAESGPVLVVLDDLQWADPSSVTVLDAIHRRLATAQVSLIVALRTGDNPIDDLLAHLNAVPLTLGPLPPDAIAALAGELTGAPPGPRLRRQLTGVGATRSSPPS